MSIVFFIISGLFFVLACKWFFDAVNLIPDGSTVAMHITTQAFIVSALFAIAATLA